MKHVTGHEWFGLVEKSRVGPGLAGLSRKERGQLLFNSFSRGHLPIQYVLELFDIGCDDCGMVVGPDAEHPLEECVVYRVMES